MQENPIYNPSGYNMPKPSRVVLLDDLSLGNINLQSDIAELARLFDTPNEVIVAERDTLISKLKAKYQQKISQGKIQPANLSLIIGNASIPIAQQLQLSVPELTVYPTRLGDEENLYIGSKTHTSFAVEMDNIMNQFYEAEAVTDSPVIALVDDTLFSGMTYAAVCKEFKRHVPNAQFLGLTLTHVPSMTDPNIMSQMEIISALRITTYPGLQQGVNSIDVRDFVEKDALNTGTTKIPFMEEENWMRSWFGENYSAAMAICSKMQETINN